MRGLGIMGIVGFVDHRQGFSNKFFAFIIINKLK